MREWHPIDTAPRDGTPILAQLDFRDGPTQLAVIRWDQGNIYFPWKGSTGHFACAEQIPIRWSPIVNMKAMG